MMNIVIITAGLLDHFTFYDCLMQSALTGLVKLP